MIEVDCGPPAALERFTLHLQRITGFKTCLQLVVNTAAVRMEEIMEPFSM